MALNWYLPQMNTTLGGVGGSEPRFGAVSLWRWATMPLTSWPAGASHSSRKIVKSRDFGLEPVYCSWWPVLDAGVGREVVDADELSTNLSGLNLNGMESSVHVVGIMPLAPARSAATDVAIEAASSSRPPPPPPGAFLSMAFSSFNGIAPMPPPQTTLAARPKSKKPSWDSTRVSVRTPLALTSRPLADQLTGKTPVTFQVMMSVPAASITVIRPVERFTAALKPANQAATPLESEL